MSKSIQTGDVFPVKRYRRREVINRRSLLLWTALGGFRMTTARAEAAKRPVDISLASDAGREKFVDEARAIGGVDDRRRMR